VLVVALAFTLTCCHGPEESRPRAA
jgi:hypothetical protein